MAAKWFTCPICGNNYRLYESRKTPGVYRVRAHDRRVMGTRTKIRCPGGGVIIDSQTRKGNN